MFSFNRNSRKHLSDAELIERYRYSYDNSYLGELFQRYSHMLFGVSMKYLKNEEKAKDIVMEVFEKVLVELKRHQVENFRTWIYSVTKNQCLMLLRKEKSADKRHVDYQYTMDVRVEFDLPAHLNGESQEETDRRLETAISELNEDQQRCIRLFYFEKRSYVEIEDITGYTNKQVKSFLQNGKRNLKIQLSKGDE